MSAAHAGSAGAVNGRQATLNSAVRNDRGYHATSMRDIARH